MQVNQDAFDLTATQVRINAKAKVDANTSAFLQLQSAHTWGTGSAAYAASDSDSSVGLHQAFFTLKNFAGLPVAAKVGRQEIVFDGHRIFGHTGWTTGAQTHDGLKLTHAHDNMSLTYAGSMAQELTGTSGRGDENDVWAHALRANFQGVLGGSLSTYLVMMDDDCGTLSSVTACVSGSNNWYTIGARQAGKIYGLDYRVEYYHQTGNAGGADGAVAVATTGSYYGTANTSAGYQTETSRDAYMFGVRVGKSFKNVSMKPKVTLWYDYLSGNSDEDMNEGTWGQFDTLFDTGHKFYGFMDLFLGYSGANVNFMGLQDFAVKVVLKPADKWTLKADVHNFRLAETVGGSPSMSILTGICSASTSSGAVSVTDRCDRSLGNQLGTELDLTLVHKYSPNVGINFGYSQFMAESLWHLVDGTDQNKGWANTGHWAYVQAKVKF